MSGAENNTNDGIAAEPSSYYAAAFLVVDKNNLDAQLSEDDLLYASRWITTAGILTLALGLIALLCPAWTSGFVVWWAAAILLLTGVFHVTGLWYAEEGLKRPTFAVGAIQILLALFAFWCPAETMFLLSILIAALFAAEGVFRMAFAWQNQYSLGNWRVMFLSGALNVLLSVLIMCFAPLAIGVLIGCNLITIGIARLAAASALRQDADAAGADTATDQATSTMV